MRRFYKALVNHPKTAIGIFLVATVVSGFLSTMVKVNYDVADYLPENSPSTIAIDVMEQEFDGGIPNARVMVKDVTIPEALKCKEQLEQCDGVTNVTWLDDAVDILQPLETMDQDTVETYYKDNAALYSVTIADGMQVEAVASMRETVGEENALSGDAVSTAVATTGTVSEVQLVTVIAVLFVLVVLIVTTTSWMEPVLVLLGVGVAVVINAGTNLMFGEISFVTNAAGPVLQLAVSLDYSVFLIHRFEECARETSEPKEAMVDALCKSTGSILSSGLTTVIGFFALIFMQFRLGSDLGLALAKGIAISLITVFVFMPAVILVCQKWLLRFRHRSFLPGFQRFGKGVSKVMIPLVCVFLVVIIPSYLASNHNDFYYSAAHIYGANTQLGQDTQEIEDLFGKSDTYVALVPRGDLEKEQELSSALQEIPKVKSILSYVDTVGAEIPMEYLDQDVLAQLESEDYSRLVLTVDAELEGEETFQLVEQVRNTLEEFYPDTYYLAGSGVTSYDLMDTITDDNAKVNLIAIGAVFLVLLLTMRSISLPVILVLGIETAVWINFSFPYFTGMTVFYISYLIVSSVQLGATVDYAILFTERYREFRGSMGKKQAVITTVSVVTPSVITSGSVLAVVGLLMHGFSTHGILSQLGLFIGVGSLLSLAVVLFVLPGLLYLLDGFVQRTTLHANFFNTSKEDTVK